PGAPRSRGSAPCRGAPGGRRWAPRAPYDPPTDSREKMEMPEVACSYTAQLFSKPAKKLPCRWGGNTRTPRLAAAATLPCQRGGSKIALEIPIRARRGTQRVWRG